MRIVAQQGEIVKAILEPWNVSFPLTLTPWKEKQEFDIKVWGRRRLRTLSNVLPRTKKLTVSLIADGMPSYWSLDVGGVELTLGLSGWTAQDWASKARFSALAPTSSVSEEQTKKALDALIKLVAVTPKSFAEELGVKPSLASSYLQKLTLIGAAMYDRNSGQYLHRQLFPQLDLTRNDDSSLEERFGVKLCSASAVTISSTLRINNSNEYRASVLSDKETNTVVLSKDEDLRVTYAQCNCSFFNFNKLKLGPCRHIVATSLAVDSL
jgi:ribosomal protein S25